MEKKQQHPAPNWTFLDIGTYAFPAISPGFFHVSQSGELGFLEKSWRIQETCLKLYTPENELFAYSALGRFGVCMSFCKNTSLTFMSM